MKKFAVLIAALGILPLASIQASATKLTQQQVKNACGSSYGTGSAGGTTVSGCDKKCGKHQCGYYCCSGKNCPDGKGCEGFIIYITAGGKKIKSNLPAATLKEIKRISSSPARPPGNGILNTSPGLGGNGPAATGTPVAPPPPTGGPILR